MSETDQAIPRAPAASTAGAMLRAAREQAGVHIASLAAALKVPVARLEALEAERFDLLPDPPFVRALAGSICRALKIDSAPVLALLPKNAASHLQNRQSKPDVGTFRTTSASTVRLASLTGGMRHPVVWVVIVLLLGAAGLLFVPSDRLGAWVQSLRVPTAESPLSPIGGGAADSNAASSDLPVAAVAPMGPESTRDGAFATSDSNSPANALQAQPQLVQPSSAPASVTALATPATTATTVADAVPADGLIVFTSTDQSWVRVTNSRGATVFEKIVKPGLPQTANGAVPLTVVVGNARATTVLLRGQAFDLVGITRNNVARFEVK